MARQPGDEDKTGFRNDEYIITINDSLGIKISETDVVAGAPYMSASVSVPITSGTAATAAIVATQHVTLADATSAEMGLTLPSAAGVIGRSYTVKKIDASANAVLLSGAAAAETVDGAAFQTLDSQNETVTVLSDGIQWHMTNFFSASAGV